MRKRWSTSLRYFILIALIIGLFLMFFRAEDIAKELLKMELMVRGRIMGAAASAVLSASKTRVEKLEISSADVHAVPASRDAPHGATHLISIKVKNSGDNTITIEQLLINGIVMCHLDPDTGAWNEAGEPSPKETFLKVPEGGCVSPATLIIRPQDEVEFKVYVGPLWEGGSISGATIEVVLVTNSTKIYPYVLHLP